MKTWSSVIANFVKIQTQWEGYLDYMYTDSIGLVTTGMGNLIDPVTRALQLAWYHRVGNSIATPDEVAEEWQRVKAAHVPGAYDAPKDVRITSLYLHPEAIQSLVQTTLEVNEGILCGWLTNFGSFPADAQMCIHGMAWAMGPGFPHYFPSFVRAAQDNDWDGARLQSHFRLEAKQRLAGHDLMLQNAAKVVGVAGDLSVLHYPASL